MDDYVRYLREYIYKKLNVKDNRKGNPDYIKVCYNLHSKDVLLVNSDISVSSDFVITSRNLQTKIHKAIYGILQIVVEDFIKQEILNRLKDEVREDHPDWDGNKIWSEANNRLWSYFYNVDVPRNRTRRFLMREGYNWYFNTN